MARKLKMFVTAHERDEKGQLTGQSGTFGPDDDLPGWAEKSISNPDVWQDTDTGSDDTAKPAGRGPAKPTAK